MGAPDQPIKLVWFEAVTDWLADDVRHELPEGVSRPAAAAVVGMVLRATRTETMQALVSARWVEKMTGVNHAAVSKVMQLLESGGWLHPTGKRLNKAPFYQVRLASGEHTSAPEDVEQSGSGAENVKPQVRDTSADSGADSGAEDTSHTPGTPGTPLEELTKEKTLGVCPNCERGGGEHDLDCPHRPFDDRPSGSNALADATVNVIRVFGDETEVVAS